MRPLIQACLMIVLSASTLPAQTSVWKISKDEHTLYLGGTCHILREKDFPLPTVFDQAYQAADTLVFEIDPNQMQSPAFSAQLMAASRYQDGRSLKDVLNTATYDALAKQASDSGIPMVVLDPIKPGMVVTMLTMQELIKIGVTREGVDLHYAKKANQDQKPIASLESIEFQINLLTSLGEGMENELVTYSLQDLAQLETLFEQLITAWRKGDTDAIHTLFVEGMREYPSVYDAMLKSRNHNWLTQIETMLTNQPVEFVLVGVGHIPGPDGLLQRLKDAGYSVEQL